MSDVPIPNAQATEDSGKVPPAVIGAGIGVVVLTIILVVATVLLAANADTAGPAVQVVRDVLIITLALELFVIGAAVAVLAVQIARFVNLLNNEIQPIVAGTQDTVRVVRGTAHFLSKHLTEPVIKAAAAIGGIARVAGNMNAIRKQTGGGVAFSTVADGSVTYEGGEDEEDGGDIPPSQVDDEA